MIISLLVSLTIFVGVYYTYQVVKSAYDGWGDIKSQDRVTLIIMLILWLMPWLMGFELLIDQLLLLVNK